MKVDLISFQEKAVRSLRVEIAEALGSYHRTKVPHVVSMQAPTGAGKTIMMAALIEAIYAGFTSADGTTYTEQPDAIFVWLSDSPELNEQSKQKIELKTSKLRFGQCVTISEDSFDMEMLEDGHVYFLNTQKISRAGNLTKHSDTRQYTIWETLDNTIKEKSDRLYFIIDEAHRGAKSKREAGTDTTIMQRFIKGYEYIENGVKRKMSPMPVVLGMSATAARFNTLIGDTNSTLHRCIITPDEVRASGLLKDRIVITYPDDATRNNDMVLLEAATEEWDKKCRRWYQYYTEQKSARVDPVFVIQVQPGHGNVLSDTDLDDVIAKIEEKLGTRFHEGEVVHCFGSTVNLEINGLNVPHINASDIADDHRIKVVLFKEALSTGWDCPRAETMMSFRVATDATYIAQLLGRMVRTPLQSRVARDDFLNDVKLYLPHFSKQTVKDVVDELQSSEGGDIPTEINGESLAEPTYISWTSHIPVRPRQPRNYQVEGQMTLDDVQINEQGEPVVIQRPVVPTTHEGDTATVSIKQDMPIAHQVTTQPQGVETQPADEGKQLTFGALFDRESVIKFINEQGYLTYLVRQDRIHDYLTSLLDLATLLSHQVIHQYAIDEVKDEVVDMIHNYAEGLRSSGKYAELSKNVLQYKLSVQVFDAFGEALRDTVLGDMLLESESDIDRQLRNAEAKLGRYGFTNVYGGKYYDPEHPNTYKIDCILFAADDANIAALGEYAKNKFQTYVSKYRLSIVNRSDACKRKYHDILADSDVVSEQIFSLPENISVKVDTDGKEYENHLFADENTGIANIKLNGWESELIEEESKRPDFVCWLRNPSRGSWALCLPYEIAGEKKAFYPDFLIVRSHPDLEYVVDILEPHGDQYIDNLPKAKGLAEYARKEDRMGRIQLIHKGTNAAGQNGFIRLDLTDIAIQDRILRASGIDDFKNIVATYGKME